MLGKETEDMKQGVRGRSEKIRGALHPEPRDEVSQEGRKYRTFPRGHITLGLNGAC